MPSLDCGVAYCGEALESDETGGGREANLGRHVGDTMRQLGHTILLFMLALTCASKPGFYQPVAQVAVGHTSPLEAAAEEVVHRPSGAMVVRTNQLEAAAALQVALGGLEEGEEVLTHAPTAAAHCLAVVVGCDGKVEVVVHRPVCDMERVRRRRDG